MSVWYRVLGRSERPPFSSARVLRRANPMLQSSRAQEAVRQICGGTRCDTCTRATCPVTRGRASRVEQIFSQLRNGVGMG